MFCPNCGNQIPENTKFCSNCGAQQTANVNTNPAPNQPSYTAQQTVSQQPVFTAPQPQPQPTQKPPKKKRTAKSIIISLVIIAVASIGGTLIGKFMVAPSMATKPNIPDTTSGYFQQGGGDTDDTGNSPAVGDVHMKRYRLRAENVVNATTTFIYQGDIVIGVTGSMTVFDTSAVDVEGLKKDVTTAQTIVEQNALKYINFTEKETPEGTAKYNLTFSFSNLDKDTKAADLAAQFIGFSADNGRIYIDTADEAITGFGYTLEAEE